MANINAYLSDILAAVYGEEVRGSIHDALEAINNESTQAREAAIGARNSASSYAEQAAESAESANGLAAQAVNSANAAGGYSSQAGLSAAQAEESAEQAGIAAGQAISTATMIKPLGYYTTYAALVSAVGNPSPGDMYGVGNEAPHNYYVWNAVENTWVDAGQIGINMATETDPTVPAWAKMPNKPTYTAVEVGAISEELKGAVNGLATLDNSGHVPVAQMPSLVNTAYQHSQSSGNPHGTTAAGIGAMPMPATALLPPSGTTLTANTIYSGGSTLLSTHQFVAPASGWAHGTFTTASSDVNISFGADAMILGETPTFGTLKLYEFDVSDNIWVFTKAVSI